MISNIASCGVHASDIAALRQNRTKKAEAAQDPAIEAGKTEKPSRPAHPHGHIPPGLARAAEKIASKIFARADADANGSVTQDELGALNSRHARNLASSDLFQTTTPETSAPTPTDTATPTTTETETSAGADTPETTTTISTETETPTPTGVTEAQLKEALTKFFYAKVGAIYTPPPPTVTERLDVLPPTETESTTPPIIDTLPGEAITSQSFAAVA